MLSSATITPQLVRDGIGVGKEERCVILQSCRVYKANAAKTRAATALPKFMVLRAPELAVRREGVALALAVELP